MAEYGTSGEIAAPADQVWDLIRDFGGIDRYTPGVDVTCDGEGEGAVRTIAMGGASIVERCEKRDDDAKVLQYSIQESPLPLSNYLSTMKVSGSGDSSTLEWSATFDSDNEEMASQIVAGIYDGGIKAIQGHFAG